MIKLDAIRAQKYVVFKEPTEFKLKNGVTIVRGENTVGKSLLFSSLNNLRFGSPMAENVGRSPKPMFVHPNGFYEAEFVINEQPVIIRQFLAGNSVKYNITVGGRTLGDMTQAAAKTFMDEFIPMSQELFSSTVYISSNSTNILRVGRGADRLKFLETFFNIESMDIVRAEVQRLLAKSKEAVLRLNYLKQEYESIETPTPHINEIIDMMHSMVASSTINSQNEAKIHVLKERLTSLEEMYKDTGYISETENNLLSRSRLVKRKRNELYEKLKTSETALAASEIFKQTKTELAEVSKKLKNIKPSSDEFIRRRRNGLAALKKGLELVTEKLKELEREKSALSNFDKTVQTARLEIETIAADKIKTHENFASFINKQRIIFEKFKHIEFSRLDYSSSVCTTCGSRLSKHDKQKLQKHERQFKLAGEVMNIINSYELPADVFEQKFNVPCVATKFDEKIAHLKREVSAYRKAVSLASTKELLNKRVKKYRQDHGNDIGVSQSDPKELKRLEKEFYAIEQALELKSKIRETRHTLKKLEKNTKPHISGPTLQHASNLVALLKDQRKRTSGNVERKHNIEQEIFKLKKLVEYNDVYEGLVKAYGPKGLRIQHISAIAEMLENSFNNYAASIFPNPIFFNFNMTSSALNISAERKLASSDVSLLSGSESRLFQVLTMAALAEFIPNASRWDTVVLDEVEANMREDTRAFYASSCIPKLVESIPKVIVVSPLSEEEFSVPNDDFPLHETRVLNNGEYSWLQ